MKAIILIFSIFCLLGCRTKTTKKTKFKSDEYLKTEFLKKTDSLIQEKEQKKESKKSEISDQKKESSTEIEVNGKAETGRPIEIYDIENGDTIQSIKVSGNADVKIKTKRSNSESNKKEDTEIDSKNALEKISKAVVNKENLKQAGKLINESAKNAKITDTSTGIYITAIVLGSVLIIILFIYLYFKKQKK